MESALTQSAYIQLLFISSSPYSSSATSRTPSAPPSSPYSPRIRRHLWRILPLNLCDGDISGLASSRDITDVVSRILSAHRGPVRRLSLGWRGGSSGTPT